MKILLVNTFYYPNIVGGTENSVKILAENLVKNGNEVAIYCIDSESGKMEKSICEGVHIYRGTGGVFNTKSRLHGSKSIPIKLWNKVIELKNYSIKKELEQVFEEFSPEVIHTNNIYGISPYIWTIAGKKQIKLVHTIRDYWCLSSKSEFTNKENCFLKLYRRYFRNLSKNVNCVTAPSKFTLNIFKEYNYFKNSNFYHINNAIEINNEAVNDIIKEKRQKEDKVINFIFVGTLEKHKGIDKLLQIFKNNNNDNIRLNICGEGTLLTEVNKFAEDDYRIKYRGKLNKDELTQEYQRNDVLIIPSMWDEPFGRVVIEGNQNGLPVIGSARGGIKEIIDNINTGELFESSNLEELDSLINYFSNRDNIKKYYNNIVNNIEKYSVNKQIDEFISIYKK